MISGSPQILFFLTSLIFGSVIFMHLSKRNSTLIFFYLIQSLIVSALLLELSIEKVSFFLILTATITLIVKAIIAPYFFRRLIHRHHLNFSVSTYLNSPLTLVVLALLTVFSYSHFFKPLSILAKENEKALLIAVAMIFISLFLIINRKGVLSQMIGILSLENGIVTFAYIAGLEAGPALQLGILFDILVWVIIATVFASMLFKQFGSLDVNEMKNLKEE